MPTTRKKIIKTVYKDEESEGEAGDFSDSGSEAKISEASSSEDEDEESIEDDQQSSGDDFRKVKKGKKNLDLPPIRRRKPKFAKDLINKINKQTSAEIFEYPNNLAEIEEDDVLPRNVFSVKDMSEADKLLPSFLNLSESDSSDDESQTISKMTTMTLTSVQEHDSDSNHHDKFEYKDVWSSNIQDNSEDIAKKTFMELEEHKKEIEKTKASVESYISKNQAAIENVSINNINGEYNVNDLLAQGEEKVPAKKKVKARRRRDDSDSEVEDWEEVNETKIIPQQGLQLFVEFPNACRKSKKLDVEMMMKRKINRVKKKYQVYMHKVHVLCWLGHGNYVSRVLNDQELMAAVLAMVPKGCYPEERLTTKYVEQITTWYKDKFTLRQDKHEHKYRPKAPPLRTTLLNQIKSRVTTAKKYNVFIFVAMLRALGLQCRVMFNFVTLPIRPPTSELCSLSTKPKHENKADSKYTENNADKNKPKVTKSKSKSSKKIDQVDGNYDSFSDSDSEYGNILQLDGSNDAQAKTRSTRSTRAKKVESNTTSDKKDEEEAVSRPKRAKTNTKDILPTKKDDSEPAPEPDKLQESQKPPPKNKSAGNKSENIADNKTSNSQTIDIADGKDKPQEATKPLLSRRSAKNNVSKTKNYESKLKTSTLTTKNKTTNDTSDTNKDILQKAPKSPRSVRNNVNTETAKALCTKREKSKSPQPTKNNDSNRALEAKTKKGTVKDSIPSTKTLPLSLSKKANEDDKPKVIENSTNSRKARSERRHQANIDKTEPIPNENAAKNQPPTIVISDENLKNIESKFFSGAKEPTKRINLSRKRAHTAVSVVKETDDENINTKPKTRTKSAPQTSIEKSKYFDSEGSEVKIPKLNTQNTRLMKKQENKLRVSHRDLKKPAKAKNDVTEDLVDIIKSRIKGEKAEARKGIVKGKIQDESDDSDFLLVEDTKSGTNSDNDFKPTKITPKPSTSKKLDRRVLSSDDELVKLNKVDVWCEVFVEELEQWIAVDVINGKVHCTADLYSHATHPICYIVGWDNNNYLKDLTRRYVPHWNTVTRKQRADPAWWTTALQPWLGPKTARDREEDEYLDRMQLEAPLPKSIAEYKNHPLYALKRHLLKFEALYPPEAATLGFVRGEAVYSRACVHTCQSRDKWLKEAKVVRLAEQPYKIVKARPKWDKLSNKCITDKPLEVFGPWQVQDYEPPTAENGIVPRNPYGNVELFKLCMLPKKTVHIKLPGLNKVAKKLNIDCAPAMTGFDFNGGFSHPVYDGFVVCEEFEEIITDAWLKDQEEQERRDREKVELRVFGNWKRLIRGLMIRERLKLKYGFEQPPASQAKPRAKGPRLVVKQNRH